MKTGGVDIGALIASLNMDISEFEDALNQVKNDLDNAGKVVKTKTDQIASEFDKVGKKMQSMGKKMSLFVTAPLVAAGAASFKYASDLNENMNKVDVAFGASADEVKKWSKTTLESFGIAQVTALEMAGLFGDMATSMGLTREAAADMSKSLVGLAGDLASFKNIDIAQAQTALAGIFTGETESLKRLGIVMTEAALSSYLMAQGSKKALDEMTQAEKVMTRYNYVLSVTTNAQGDFLRTSDGAANQMRIFKESLKEVGTTFGELFLPIITPFIKGINDILKWVKNLNEEQRRWVVTTAAVVAAIGPVVWIIGKLVSGVGLAIQIFIKLRAVILAIRTAMLALSTAMATNPIGALLLVLGAAAGALLLFTSRTKSAEDAQWKLGDAVKDVNDQLAEQIANAIFGGVQDDWIETTNGVYKGVKILEKSIEDMKSALTKLSSQELYAVQSFLQNKLTQSIREAANETDDLQKSLLNQDITTYKRNLELVNAELQKFASTSTITAKNINVNMSKAKPLGNLQLPTQTVTGNLAITPDTTGMKDLPMMKTVMDDYTKSLEGAATASRIFGSQYDYIGVQLDITGQAIDQLINLGFKETDSVLENLILTWKKLDKQMEKSKKSFIDWNEISTNVASEVGTAFMNMAMEGEWAIGKLIKAMLAQITAQLISKMLASLPFPANIILAGTAGAVAGTLFAQIPEFADGGLIYGPTIGKMGEYPGAATNPEVVAPLNTLRDIIREEVGGMNGTVEFIITGDKLVGVLDNYGIKRRRFV